MRHILRNKLAVLLFFIFVGLTNANLVGQNVKITASLDSNAIVIGDQTYLNIEISKPKKLELYWNLPSDTIINLIEILDLKIDTNISNNIETIKYQFKITCFDSGYYAIPPFVAKYNITNDTIFDHAETDALLLTVNSIPVDLNGQIKDIKDVISEPYTFKEIFIRYILPIIGILILAFLVYYFYRRYKQNKPLFIKPEKPRMPADLEAIQALNQLKSEKLWQNNLIKEYYSQLTDIMRVYIERVFDFPAQEMVSSEIIGSLKSCNLTNEIISGVEENLRKSDLVKFAKFNPIHTENEEIMNWAYEFISKTQEQIKTEEVKS